jgi:L-aminopeptidase/D-esterase-like protein
MDATGKNSTLATIFVAAFLTVTSTFSASSAPLMRARDLGIPLDGVTGALNAITDVPGLEVGQTTISDKSRQGGARTGVSAIFPLGKASPDCVTAGWFAFNGTGEMTSTKMIDEFGAFCGPVMLTGTLSVGLVHNATLEWIRQHISDPNVRFSRILPVVAETYDGGLNDAWGFHVHKEHVFAALDNAKSGPVEEGNVGGGTGMVAHYFKGGIGTASRIVDFGGGAKFTVGVLVQANYGKRDELTIAGVPVGKEIHDLMPKHGTYQPAHDGSIIIIVATDAPLLAHQLKRVARRATIGLAHVGGTGNTTSGDIFLAFSTANHVSLGAQGLISYAALPDMAMDPIFAATYQATEEAILNALVAGRTMEGGNGGIVYALPQDRVRDILKKYNRLK